MKLLIIILSITVTIVATNTHAQVVNVKAINGLKYDVTSFNVKPGAEVTLTLNNVSDMAHNLIITKPGARDNVVRAALDLAGDGPKMNYTPTTDDVLWSIPLISPGQSATIKFRAPKKKGVYPYVCTYPGHGYVMFGEMRVTSEGDAPLELAKRETEKHETHTSDRVPPYLYHAFIDGASPAAIAVHLPGKLSYCWDMTTCSLRFAWSGDFLDMSDLWKGHFDASAKILGEIFYRGGDENEIRTGDLTKTPVVKYKGYRMLNRYPEFHYIVNGVDVYELTMPKEDGYGLIREFRMPDVKENVSVGLKSPNNSITYACSAGRMEGGWLKLSAADARHFTITITSYNIAYKLKNR